MTARDSLQEHALHLDGLSKHFGETVAVNDVSMAVQTGEFVTLLGPSGSGKTTTLRIVSGFTQPDHGKVLLRGTDITRLPPYKRNLGMVFQNYALFPHMTASENIAFPLRMRSVAREETGRRVERALSLTHLNGLGGRYPRELSGGQQQRVALARAVVFEPSVLLMDEPLGALDRKLREALQGEIMHISRSLGVTVLYVTHDQDEALAMSDRIAIYNHGRIEQIGRAEELYERPSSVFVAGFMGDSNIFQGSVRRSRGGLCLSAESLEIPVDRSYGSERLTEGQGAAVMIRPERIGVASSNGPTDELGKSQVVTVRGRIAEETYLGSSRRYAVALETGQRISVRVTSPGDAAVHPGDEVVCWWKATESVVLTEDEVESEPPAESDEPPPGQVLEKRDRVGGVARFRRF